MSTTLKSVECPFCSATFTPRKKARSSPHHRRFFGIIRAAFEAWPETHSEQPKTALELRKWLVARAGYVERIIIEPPPSIIAENPRFRAEAKAWLTRTIRQFRAMHEITWVSHEDGNLVIEIPRSVAYDAMTQAEFGDLADKVAGVIWQETGMDADELLIGSRKCTA